MPKIKIDGFKQYQNQLNELELSALRVIKPAIYVGAGIVADEVRAQLRRALAGSKHSTGALLRSINLDDMRDDNGFVNTHISFPGYGDEAGKRHPNPPKAYVLEKGRAGQKRVKQPFVARAIKATKEKCIQAMDKEVNERIQKIMNENS